jgi:hypothetical protein
LVFINFLLILKIFDYVLCFLMLVVLQDGVRETREH